MLVNLPVALVFGYVIPNLDFVGTLVSLIGGGSGVGFRPFVVPPPSCRVGRFHTTESEIEYFVCLRSSSIYVTEVGGP